jgi:hypothetical protein
MNAVGEPPLQQIASDLFRDYDGDEAGGRHAIRGFSFQVWHAVLEALRAHKKGNDYAVVLEWQQDVAVLDSSTAPTKVRFVQLKKHETATHWKFAHLIKALEQSGAEEGGTVSLSADVAQTSPALAVVGVGSSKKAKPKKVKPKQSILAKLYAHRRRFKTLAQSRLEFASDAEFEVPDGAGKHAMHESIELSALPENVRAGLESSLRLQLEIDSTEEVDLSDFALVTSDCPVSEAHKYLAGELAEMQMTSEFNLGGPGTLLAVLIIASYVNLRAGKRGYAKNFSELLSRAVTRDDIALYLAVADNQTVSAQDLVGEVLNRLTLEGAPFHLVKRMRREVVRACVEVTNRAGRVPVIAAYLKSLYEFNSEYENISKLSDILSVWFDDFQKLQLNEAGDYSREYIYCLMSMIAEDANPTKQLPSVSLGPQLKDPQ